MSTICNHCKNIPDKFVYICDITGGICGADTKDHIYCMKITELEQECKELKDHIKFIQETNNILYSDKKDLLLNIDSIIKEFEIEPIKDVKTGKIIYRSKKLLKYKSTLNKLKENLNSITETL